MREGGEIGRKLDRSRGGNSGSGSRETAGGKRLLAGGRGGKGWGTEKTMGGVVQTVQRSGRRKFGDLEGGVWRKETRSTQRRTVRKRTSTWKGRVTSGKRRELLREEKKGGG